jgi:glutamine amidotransferase
MIGVIDSKICNLFSLTNMIKKMGGDFFIITRPEDFKKADKVILPGVGAFPKAMSNLKDLGFLEPLKEHVLAGRYLLGICLGLQLLLDESEEFGPVTGLGFIPGKAIKIRTSLVLPHMGWNDITIHQEIPLLKGVGQNSDCYFVHSFRADLDRKYIAATAEYGETIPAVIFKDNVMGTQFHPEKSQKWGEVMIRNYIGLK